MKTTKVREIKPVDGMSFVMIARELGENESAVFECYKRALKKLNIALRRKGYQLDDFFGNVKNEH